MTESLATPITSIEHCGADTISVRLGKPSGYSFKAGQWMRVILVTESGSEAHTFSHAAAPHDPWLEFTTRLSGSAFKRALAGLTRGDVVHITAAGGRLALPKEVERVAFLVGGVGITPIRSLLRDAAHCGRVFDDALLVYGNRDESCEPYLDELMGMVDIGLRCVRVIQNPTPTWNGERGFVTAEIVARHVDAADGRPFYVTGPPAMVTAMEHVLDELGISGDRRIVEAFGPRQAPTANQE